MRHLAKTNPSHHERVEAEFERKWFAKFEEILDDEWHRIVAYVLNNPLKAGYVKRWQDWKWNYRRV